jgi:hypothetical protein
MKIPSLFTKTPSHHRFNYKPRFYNAEEEERKEREERIRRELELEKGIVSEDAEIPHRSRIAGAFQAARKRSQKSSTPNAALMRTASLLFLVLFIIAFLQWGRPAMYLAFLIVPFYLYAKFKK